ncbi:hypothetical protein [Streptosporangium subroseum]|uniref:hypothetical protein n=1 Tax=Streptosporangium subroseum TaxID=106412 RepID=UPI003085A3EC|nr:hypothetical protein OHB15_22435 [Streptosporangium subroseum]
MKRRIIFGVCLPLTAVLGLTGAVGYLTFLRPADNPPADACIGQTGTTPPRGRRRRQHDAGRARSTMFTSATGAAQWSQTSSASGSSIDLDR